MSLGTTSDKRLLSFKVAAATSRGYAVKPGSSKEQVAVVTAATDKAIGILQNTTTATDEVAEVALPGGGAIAKLGGTVSFGDILGFATDGRLVKVANTSDRVIAMAMQDGVANDLIAVEVMVHKAESAQA